MGCTIRVAGGSPDRCNGGAAEKMPGSARRADLAIDVSAACRARSMPTAGPLPSAIGYFCSPLWQTRSAVVSNGSQTPTRSITRLMQLDGQMVSGFAFVDTRIYTNWNADMVVTASLCVAAAR